MNLYNLRTTELGYRISKFDMDANWLASYELDAPGKTCTCPASHRPDCKHRKMIYRMRQHINDGWFLCWETQKWHRPINDEPESVVVDNPKPLAGGAAAEGGSEQVQEPEIAVPEGATVIGLGDPKVLHETIAEAVDEPHHIMRR